MHPEITDLTEISVAKPCKRANLMPLPFFNYGSLPSICLRKKGLSGYIPWSIVGLDDKVKNHGLMELTGYTFD